MSAKLHNEIILREELRPAIYTVYKGKDENGKYIIEQHNVLVHTTKTGRHGGWLIETDVGEIMEFTGNTYENLIFTDNLHSEYSFELMCKGCKYEGTSGYADPCYSCTRPNDNDCYERVSE